MLEMPSGTGKTTTILSLVTSYAPGQTAEAGLPLGLSLRWRRCGGGGVTEGKLQKLLYCTRTVPEMEKVRGGGLQRANCRSWSTALGPSLRWRRCGGGGGLQRANCRSWSTALRPSLRWRRCGGGGGLQRANCRSWSTALGPSLRWRRCGGGGGYRGQTAEAGLLH